jgi:hypothetical protein
LPKTLGQEVSSAVRDRRLPATPSLTIGAVFVATVAFSRLYLGVHYLSDVLASVLISSAAILLWFTVWNNLVVPRLPGLLERIVTRTWSRTSPGGRPSSPAPDALEAVPKEPEGYRTNWRRRGPLANVRWSLVPNPEWVQLYREDSATARCLPGPGLLYRQLATIWQLHGPKIPHFEVNTLPPPTETRPRQAGEASSA